MTEQEWDKKIAEWSMHWDAGSFLKDALGRAFRAGKDEAFQEMIAMKEAILELQKRNTGPELLLKDEKE